MRDFIYNVVAPLVFVAMVLFGIVFLIAAPAIWYTKVQCDNQLEALQLEGYFKIFGGCFAKTTANTYVPLDYYRGFETLKLDHKRS